MTKSFGMLMLLALTAGCSFHARSPDEYRDATQALLDSKSADIKTCYDGVLKGTPGVGGKVTVHFDVLADEGKIANVAVDKAGTTAPDAVAECVKHAIGGLSIDPADARLGQATFVYEFSQPPAPPAPKS